ncbi:MAG: hypothetical protein ACK5O8_05075 [Pirellula sp.]
MRINARVGKDTFGKWFDGCYRMVERLSLDTPQVRRGDERDRMASSSGISWF